MATLRTYTFLYIHAVVYTRSLFFYTLSTSNHCGGIVLERHDSMKTLFATLLLSLPVMGAELITYGPTPYSRIEDSPFFPWSAWGPYEGRAIA